MHIAYTFFFTLQISGLSDIYHFELTGLEKTNLRADSPLTIKSEALKSEPFVKLLDNISVIVLDSTIVLIGWVC